MASVLITGSSGRIGRAVVAELMRRGHAVRGFDLAPGPEIPDFVQGTLMDRMAVDHAMRGIECLVHLAATPDDADFLTELLPNNLLGVYHVLESARLAGVRRLILASSGQVNWWQGQRGELPLHPKDPPTPKSWYAATKLFLEGIGRSFSEMHGMSVIVARLGWCPRTEEQRQEIAAAEWAQNVYLSPGDAGRFFACAIEAPESVRYALVNAAGRPRHREHFDMTSARTLLGYEPRDEWPEGLGG
ncbi:MAG: NAD(P)-dependent oxidoreductase [Verrucomicrobiales bacterium]|nr:NAD(P)-dependent oxidoreductase [Verrucomicrobiales bacterium]